jgi:hypothetical protein
MLNHSSAAETRAFMCRSLQRCWPRATSSSDRADRSPRFWRSYRRSQISASLRVCVQVLAVYRLVTAEGARSGGPAGVLFRQQQTARWACLQAQSLCLTTAELSCRDKFAGSDASRRVTTRFAAHRRSTPAPLSQHCEALPDATTRTPTAGVVVVFRSTAHERLSLPSACSSVVPVPVHAG